ncbi:MAG: trypsin-like peptidase domain-containing protein [Streptosporangiaceae bacterium]
MSGDPAPRSAHLAGSYAADDLAAIRVDDPSGLQPARFGDLDKAQAGDVVLAAGNLFGLSSGVTAGNISATGRAVAEPASPDAPAATLPVAIQTSTRINPGNSGGALVKSAGEVTGIPALAEASPQDSAQVQGIGFAIPPAWPATSPAGSAEPGTSPTPVAPHSAPRSPPSPGRITPRSAPGSSKSPAAARRYVPAASEGDSDLASVPEDAAAARVGRPGLGAAASSPGYGSLHRTSIPVALKVHRPLRE